MADYKFIFYFNLGNNYLKLGDWIKMKKVIKINTCADCPYQRGLIWACYNPIVNRARLELRSLPEDEDIIPSWCPLSDVDIDERLWFS